jgi:hypothetical protein
MKYQQLTSEERYAYAGARTVRTAHLRFTRRQVTAGRVVCNAAEQYSAMNVASEYSSRSLTRED